MLDRNLRTKNPTIILNLEKIHFSNRFFVITINNVFMRSSEQIVVILIIYSQTHFLDIRTIYKRARSSPGSIEKNLINLIKRGDKITIMISTKSINVLILTIVIVALTVENANASKNFT